MFSTACPLTDNRVFFYWEYWNFSTFYVIVSRPYIVSNFIYARFVSYRSRPYCLANDGKKSESIEDTISTIRDFHRCNSEMFTYRWMIHWNIELWDIRQYETTWGRFLILTSVRSEFLQRNLEVFPGFWKNIPRYTIVHAVMNRQTLWNPECGIVWQSFKVCKREGSVVPYIFFTSNVLLIQVYLRSVNSQRLVALSQFFVSFCVFVSLTAIRISRSVYFFTGSHLVVCITELE